MSDYLIDANNDVLEYVMSHDIPTCFYQCLFGELVKVWGIKMILPDPDYLAEYDEDGNMLPSCNDDYSYRDQLDYFLNMASGTIGWNSAFNGACVECGLVWLMNDYNKMDWVRSDIFDVYITDRMMDVMFAENYKFSMNKENNNETT